MTKTTAEFKPLDFKPGHNEIHYEPHPLTLEFMNEIVGTDNRKAKKILGDECRTATLFRIDFMRKAISCGLVKNQSVAQANNTIALLEGML